MNALIRMQPLDVKRQPLYPMQLVGTVPRDAQPHRVGGVWELDPKKEMPYFVRVFADNKSIIREIQAEGPSHLRKLNSVTFYMDLTVLPRKS